MGNDPGNLRMIRKYVLDLLHFNAAEYANFFALSEGRVTAGRHNLSIVQGQSGQ